MGETVYFYVVVTLYVKLKIDLPKLPRLHEAIRDQKSVRMRRREVQVACQISLGAHGRIDLPLHLVYQDRNRVLDAAVDWLLPGHPARLLAPPGVPIAQKLRVGARVDVLKVREEAARVAHLRTLRVVGGDNLLVGRQRLVLRDAA